MRYATLPEDELEDCDDMLLLDAIEVLEGYGLEVVQVDNVGGTNYWYIKVAGEENRHAPGRFMDWNEGTLEITP